MRAWYEKVKLQYAVSAIFWYTAHLTLNRASARVHATVAWRCLCTIYGTIDVVTATTTPRSVIYMCHI